MVDLKVVVDKLQSLETAEDIADFLHGHGVKAQPQEARSCAISVFIAEETGLGGKIVTTTECISVDEVIYDSDGYSYEKCIDSFPHTDAMRHFVRNFDAGEYMFLVEDGFDFEPYSGECHCSECFK